ncbi:MAG: flagellar motor switch phosphatase FliY [Mesoaciditoga sp.]|nr:MAG: flagellar motor switch phosphatase FliY [Mesoaciditoga sp.]PMP80426.1 MAG: flagellar motor switch phosphatase FliY [Mesoaciditoga sp.]
MKMADKMSQEEIDSLLKGSTTILTELEKDAIGELGNISMGAAATAISTIVGKRVEITTPEVYETTMDDFRKLFKGMKIATSIDYVKTLQGTNVFVLEPHVVAVIADIMMGGTGQDVKDELDDIKLSAIAEAMNQMMGSAATSLSEIMKESVEISPPKIEKIDFTDPNVKFPPVYDGQDIVTVKFKMKVNNLVEGSLIELMSPSFAKNFSKFLIGEVGKSNMSRVENSKIERSEETPQMADKSEKPVRKVEFQEFSDEKDLQVQPQKIELLLDIPLELSVELGRTKMSLKQVLELGVGSLVELDKLTGEPVDILVNGKQIAKGEVVVVGENFGVKITQILNKKERLYSLK